MTENKRDNSELEMSPESNGDDCMKLPRIHSPVLAEPIVLPEDTPIWAKALYTDLCNRMSTLETNINSSINFAGDTATNAFTATGVNKRDINLLSKRCDVLENDLKQSELKNKLLEEKIIGLESYSRRENLLFYGVLEEKGETSNMCEKKLRRIFKDLDLHDFEDIKIVRCHRKGPPMDKKVRPIIAKFHWHGDINRIMEMKKNKLSKDSKIFITQDWPKEIAERRRILGPIFKHAKSSGLAARLVSDRLYINSKLYTVDNLDTLPSLINPLTTSTQEHENTVAFWGKFSPYSTFHEHVFLFQDSQYYTVEQCLQHQKAMFFNDCSSAKKIMNESDPLKCRYIGKNIINFDGEKWKPRCNKLMSELLFAKFSGDSNLQSGLLKTGEKTICQASINDLFWGAGVALRDTNVTDSSKWSGKNMLGKLLMEVRDQIKKQSMENVKD